MIYTADELKTALVREGYELWPVKSMIDSYNEETFDDDDYQTARLADHCDCYASSDFNISLPDSDNVDGVDYETFINKLCSLHN